MHSGDMPPFIAAAEAAVSYTHLDVYKRQVIYTNVRLQDDAKVVSGRLLISGSYDDIKDKLKEGLEEFAAAVNEKGGVVGHIKACLLYTSNRRRPQGHLRGFNYAMHSEKV